MRERRSARAEEPIIEFEDFEHFESAGTVPDGRFVIPYNSVPVDFLYEPVEYAKATVVLFHGSTNRDVDLPMFSGRGIMQGIAANRLAISDPSLTLDDSHELILSWFAGSSSQPRLQFFLESTIRRIREITGTPRFIFMGGSGGGFASLEMGRRFPGSVVVTMNPQTNMAQYYGRLRRQYLELCWADAKELSELPPYVTHDLATAYSETLNNTIAYIQNTRDTHHIENHMIPFVSRVGHSGRFFTFLDAWGDPMGKGHVPPPRVIIRRVLETLVESKGAWRKALEDLEFTRRSNEMTIRQVVELSNSGLPSDHEVDDM